jgi:hypothetical protein
MRAKSTYGGVPGASLIDWPISFEELEKYYEIAERRMVVTRRNGVPGLPASNNFKVMYAGAKKLGYKQVHTGHMAINSRDAHRRARSSHYGASGRFGYGAANPRRMANLCRSCGTASKNPPHRRHGASHSRAGSFVRRRRDRP